MYISSEYEFASYSTSITVAIFGVGGREGGRVLAVSVCVLELLAD